MNCKLKKTDMDYIVIVNHPALQKRAEELGYQAVNYIPLDKLSEEEDALEQEVINGKKSAVVFYFRPKEEEEDLGSVEFCWLSSEVRLVEYHLFGREIDETQTVSSLEEAIRFFPSLREVEKDLERYNILPSTDYEGRCGNCHSSMDENDKYCKRCGTKRGEGKFLPYRNEVYYLYGAPRKKKYKCASCGYIWIVNAAGWKDSLYCPQCGKDQPSVIKEHVCWEFWLGDPVAKEEPYDEDQRPVLLTEEQVKDLLNCRIKDQTDCQFDSPEAVLKVMKKWGFPLPDSTRDKKNRKYVYPITEAEHEQMLQVFRVLNTKGNNLNAFRDISCPYCHSQLIAALAYTVKNKSYREVLAEAYHIRAKEDALIFKEDELWVPERDEKSRSAYLCLCCGTEFGELKWEPEANNE